VYYHCRGEGGSSFRSFSLRLVEWLFPFFVQVEWERIDERKKTINICLVRWLGFVVFAFRVVVVFFFFVCLFLVDFGRTPLVY
jgi:hypothetical protein